MIKSISEQTVLITGAGLVFGTAFARAKPGNTCSDNRGFYRDSINSLFDLFFTQQIDIPARNRGIHA